MLEDKDILELFHKEGGEDQAFNLIVRKYSERLYWHIRKMTSSHEETNDLLQNTFVKAWRYLPSFREQSKLYTWLYRIATNETLTYLKRERLKSYFSLTDYTSQIENKVESDPYFNGDLLQKELYKAIGKLPPKQKSVFIMRYFDELKYEDISEIMNVSVSALKASYHHAYQKIQKSIRELD